MPKATGFCVWPSLAQLLCQPWVAKSLEGLSLPLPLDPAIVLLNLSIFHAEPDWQLHGPPEQCDGKGNNNPHWYYCILPTTFQASSLLHFLGISALLLRAHPDGNALRADMIKGFTRVCLGN